MSIAAVTALVTSMFSAENPQHLWVIGFVVCAVLCLPRATRRLGGISLLVGACMMTLSIFLHNTFAAFTPHS